MKKTIKIILITILTIILILFGILLTCFLIYFFDEKDFCLDTGICKEGLELNTEYGLIQINKENCLKYGWGWEEGSGYCNTRNK